MAMVADMPVSLDELERLHTKPAYVQQADDVGAPPKVDTKKLTPNAPQVARKDAVKNTALSIGIKAGVAYQLKNIADVVETAGTRLSSIYDFTPLMVNYRVVPPVITEARELFHQEGDATIRLSGALYKIERQARFSSLPPTWRDYLIFPKPEFNRDSLYSVLTPANEEEAEIWKFAVRDGWNQGVEQANLMFQMGFDRLNRDFTGMIRFQRFVKERKITMPIVADQYMPINLSGDSMAVDEQLFRITVLPEFNGRIEAWKALPTSDPIVMSGRQPVPTLINAKERADLDAKRAPKKKAKEPEKSDIE